MSSSGTAEPIDVRDPNCSRSDATMVRGSRQGASRRARRGAPGSGFGWRWLADRFGQRRLSIARRTRTGAHWCGWVIGAGAAPSITSEQDADQNTQPVLGLLERYPTAMRRASSARSPARSKRSGKRTRQMIPCCGSRPAEWSIATSPLQRRTSNAHARTHTTPSRRSRSIRSTRSRN